MKSTTMKSSIKSNRLLAFALALVLSFGLAACNNRPTTTTPTTTTPTTTTPTTTTPATTTPATTAPAAAPATTTDPAATAPATTDPAATGTTTTPGATTTPAAGATTTTPETTTTTGTATTPATAAGDAAEGVAEGVEGAADAVGGAVAGAAGEVSATLGTARREAVQELESLNLDTQNEATVQEAQVAVATARQNLQNAYQGAGDTATAEWQELQTEFDRVEQSLETGAANALEQVRALITRLQQGLN